jgi:zinc D-Ala-D-Ala dipeptidase
MATVRRRTAPTSNAQPFDFRLTPLRPVARLLAEARTLAPPHQAAAARSAELVDLAQLAPALRLDIRYAREENFLGAKLYSSPRAFLQRPAAEALLRVEARLRSLGLGLVVFDAYRPWHVTWAFWEATPPEHRMFVADPAKGSKHNRGCAVDVGLVSLRTGRLLPMPSGFDEFTPRAYADYPGGNARARSNRELLREVMAQEGFTMNPKEWWHFDHRDWERYPLENASFEALEGRLARAGPGDGFEPG